MSTPIIESVAVNLLAAVNLVKVANGYNQDLTAQRPSPDTYDGENQPDPGEVVVALAQTRRVEDSAVGTQEWEQDFLIEAFVGAADQTMETAILKVWADLHKAVLTDVTLSGVAHDVRIGEPEFINYGPTPGVAVIVTVEYRTLFEDPYTQG